MTIKRLSPKPTELNFRQGFNFGMGFMAAVLIFSVVIIPALACGAAVILASLPTG